MYGFRMPVLLFCMVCVAGFCVAGEAEPISTETKGAEAPKTVSESLRTPRSTMRTFLRATRDVKEKKESRLKDAVQCLDLSEMDAITRRDYGPKLVWMIVEILDRTWRVELSTIPDKPDGESFSRVLERDGNEYGVLEMSRRPNGEWLFDADFLERVPEILKALQNVRRFQGLTGGAGQDPAIWLQERMPAELREVGFLLEHWQWLGIAASVLIGVVLERVFGWIMAWYVVLRTRRAHVIVPEELFRKAERPLGFAVMAILWWFALHLLNLPPQIHGFLGTITSVLAGVAGVLMAYRIVDIVATYFTVKAAQSKNKMDDLLVPMARRSLKVLVVIFGIVFVASNMGVNITALLAGLGIGGIALALAAKDTVENLFGSITVLVDRPFQIGDWVVINGVEGNIEDVGFRSTRIRTFYNSLVTVPNSKLVNASIDNMGARSRRRIRTMLSVAYSTPVARIHEFCEGVRDLIRKRPCTCKDNYHVYFNEFGPSSLDILLYCFVETPDWGTELRERERLFSDIKLLAERLEVEFAFPTQTLHIDSFFRNRAEFPSREGRVSGDKRRSELAGGTAPAVME